MVFDIIEIVTTHVAKAGSRVFGSLKAPVRVEVPTAKEHGDLSTNLALIVAKQRNENPMQLAEKLAAELRNEMAFEKVVVAAPGFVNFFLKPAFLLSSLKKLVSGLDSFPKQKQKIVIEHTNVNPNKAMHIGHLRNAVLGDVINRVLRRAGFTTEVQYYVDDTGVQVVDTFLGLKELKDVKRQDGEKYDHFCWRVYTEINETYEEQPKLLQKRALILQELEEPASATAKSVHAMAVDVLRDHLWTMGQFSIDYDLLVWESHIVAMHFWGKAFELLKKSKDFIKETKGKNAGCWVIKNPTEQGDADHSPDKVIVKSDGTVTYTGKDIAYHLWKYDLLGADFLYAPWSNAQQEKKLTTTDPAGKKAKTFGHADRVYNVIDVRQAYPQAMVRFALETLGYGEQATALRHVSYGVVALSAKTSGLLGTGNKEKGARFSMSGRKGFGIKVDDLLTKMIEEVKHRDYEVTSERTVEKIKAHDVAVGAIKYFMLRYNPHTDIVFDLEEALSLQGNTGVYLQYAHARAAGILEKAGTAAGSTQKEGYDLSPSERMLLAKLFLWPSVLADAAESLAVNDICTYAFELAERFNAFYEANPVNTAEGSARIARLELVSSFKKVLYDIACILGIVAPDKM